MKSIIQEASSIAKAVEQGWLKAGQPQEFSVKVLELPERNFIGFTTRSAKVALLFHDKKEEQQKDVAHKNRQPQQQRAPQRQAPEREVRQQQQVERQQRPVRQERPERVERKEQFESRERQDVRQSQEHQERRQNQYQPLWTDAMVTEAQAWLETTLKLMDKSAIAFTIEPQQFHLRIVLTGALSTEEPEKEKHVLASLSALLLETLKRKFRKQLRGHKIVITQ